MKRNNYNTWCARVNITTPQQNRNTKLRNYPTWYETTTLMGQLLCKLVSVFRNLSIWGYLRQYSIDSISYMVSPPHDSEDSKRRHCDDPIVGDAFLFLNGSNCEYNVMFYVEQNDTLPAHTIVVPPWGVYLCKGLARWGYYHTPSHTFEKEGMRIGLTLVKT